MAKTKKVRIVLAGLVRLEYSEVVEVPIDATNEDLERLVEEKYDEVDGGEYRDDPDYWEQGHCYYEIERDDEAA